MAVRPSIKTIVISRHFLKDLKDDKAAESLIQDILDCANAGFHELHRFEESIDGNMIFRAKRDGTHVVYGVDKKMRIIFLRVFKNYGEYERFLENKKEIGSMMSKL